MEACAIRFVAGPNMSSAARSRPILRPSAATVVWNSGAAGSGKAISPVACFRQAALEMLATSSAGDAGPEGAVAAKAARSRFMTVIGLGRSVGLFGEHRQPALVHFGEAALDGDPLGRVGEAA